MALPSRRITRVCAVLLLLACHSQKNAHREPQEAALTNTLPVADTLMPPTAEAIPTLPRYAVRPAEWYAYRMTRIDTLRQDTLLQTSFIEQYYTKTVRAVHPDGRIECSLRIDSIRAHFTAAGTTGVLERFAYNSADSSDRNNPNYAHLTALLGTDVRMLITPDGRVDSIFGLEAVLQKLRRLSPDTLPESLDELMKQRLEEQMYRPLQQEYLAFPTEPLDSTWSWRHEYPDVLASVFPTRSIAEYRIIGTRPARTGTLLDIEASLRSQPLQRRLRQGSLEASLQKEALSGSGRILVDAQRGYTVAKNITLQTRFEVLLRDTLQKQSQRLQQEAYTRVQFQLAQQGWSKK